MERQDLFDHLDKNTDVLRNESVRAAFDAVDRADFVSDDYKVEAYEDYSLPQAAGQSILKPTVAAFMLELLGAEPGDSVLEIGAGSGWMTALLAHIVGETGKVTGVEAVPELADMARENIGKLSLPQVRIENSTKVAGFGEDGPYDRILCTADADAIPEELVAELKDGGTLVMPIGGSIVKAVKRENGQLIQASFPGVFTFPPLV